MLYINLDVKILFNFNFFLLQKCSDVHISKIFDENLKNKQNTLTICQLQQKY